jgi:hypothetical protein
VQVSLEPPAEPPPVLNKNKNIQIKKRNKHFFNRTLSSAALLRAAFNFASYSHCWNLHNYKTKICTNKNTGVTYMFFCNSFNCRTKRGPVSHWALYSAQTFAQVAVFEDVTQFFVDLSSIIFAYLSMDKKMLN